MKNAYKIRLFVSGLVLIFAALAFFGVFYPVKFLDLEFAPLMQRSLDYTLLSSLLFSGVILLTLLFGRFYCSILCPFGVLQEFAAIIFKKKDGQKGNFGFKYLIFALTTGALVGGSALFIRYIDPYTIFGSMITLSLFGFVTAVPVLILVFYKNRFFCTNICPIGAILGLLSKISFFKIYTDENLCIGCGKCAKNCPSGCIEKEEKLYRADNETCIKCLKCLSICPKGAMKFGLEPKKIKFSIERRKVLWAMGAFAFLGAGYALGLNFAKKTVKNIKNIILPAGAIDLARMENKCFNCNLCINNCPNKIITKANGDFGAVHIDYSKGEGYCKFDCNNCSKTCPTGAIKKITLSEKQSTRIGMAMIKEEKCIKCGLCAEVCPKSAISSDANSKDATRGGENSVKIDGSKCIGCGLCAKKCPHNAIEIFGINKQATL